MTGRTAAEDIALTDVFYEEQLHSQHAHMLHQHSGVLELLYVYSGEGRYLVGNREYAVRAGDLVICNAETLHGEVPFQEHRLETYCCVLTGLHLPGLRENCLIDSARKPVVTPVRFRAAVHNLMRSIYELYPRSGEQRALCRQLAVSVLMMVQQELREQEDDGRHLVTQRTENLVRGITEYLDQHYTEPITLEQISGALHISVSQLSHAFKRETGLSPIQYVIHRRIGEAQSLLVETELPIHRIEEQLGFGSSCHLTAMFKKYVGLSPREYRKYYRRGQPGQ
ncbi:MAG: helix-turn-helix domain-containing protein [Butyricicoccaceae bacterium]